MARLALAGVIVSSISWVAHNFNWRPGAFPKDGSVLDIIPDLEYTTTCKAWKVLFR
jgi:hypothetical protein